VTTSPAWARTALVINYDEWGGFYDHVAPTAAPDARPDLGTALRGFRVPCILISPRARRGYVDHTTYDHTSILKMIEWRHGLSPLTVRDAAANNLAGALDFRRPPNLQAPAYAVPSFVGLPCDPVPVSSYPSGAVSGFESWHALRDLAAATGYRVGV
jgi:phospholipase C